MYMQTFSAACAEKCKEFSAKSAENSPQLAGRARGYSAFPVRLSRSFSALLLIVTAGCRIHDLQDGKYALTPTEILRDDCSLAQQGILGTALLRTEGNLVTLTLSQPDLRLVGTYRFSTEEMTLDGTLSNFSTQIRGRECLLDTVNFHVDTFTNGPTTFHGAMSINYEARQPDECVCKYWFKFDAQRQ